MKVLVITGRSGGHIYPALSYLYALKEKGAETLFVLPRKNSCPKMPSDIGRVEYISIESIRFRLDYKSFISMFNFFKESLESLILLVNFKPDIVAGFGTINSVPMILFAWLFRIKTLIHEQNVIPGKASRFLSKISDRIAISFPETRVYFGVDNKKVFFSGNPLRKELRIIPKEEALYFFGLRHDKFTILICGGSQGSSGINKHFIDALASLVDKNKIQIIHISGAQDHDLLVKAYRDLDIIAKVYVFLEEMQFAYSACDLAVLRAGASTIAELEFFGVPAIIIPYPYAYKHQVANARVFQESGCAVIIEDNDSSAIKLAEEISGIMNNAEKINKMWLSYKKIGQNQAKDLLTDQTRYLFSD